MTREFPDVHELLSQPDRWLHGQDDVQALIVHGARAGTHGVAPGLMPHQRSQIVEWAEQALFPELVRVPDLGRSRLSPDKPAIRPPQGSRAARDAGEQRVARIRRAAIARNCPQQEAAGKPVFGSRLLWQSEKVRDIAIKGLVSALGLDADGARRSSEAAPGATGPVVLTWITDELIVRLRCLRLGHGLGDPLDMPPNPKDKRAEHTAAIEGRQQAMAKFLASDGAEATVPQLAVVELARGRAFGAPQNDPKFALRLGSANAGVPTQFLADWVPAKARHRTDSDEGRGRAAWLDGFRQLGASSFPTPQISGGIPTDTQYLAVWMVSTGRSPAKQPARKFPVAVLIRPETGEHATVLGWDSEAFGGVGEWTSYSRLLTRLSSLTRIKPAALAADAADHDQFSSDEWSKFDQRQRESERFIQKVLHSREIRCRPTVLLVDSQNSRGLWTWVRDGTAREDLIRTGQAPAAGMNPWLRLVRIRTADMDETPQWWGIDNPSGVNGLAAGLWHQSASAERTSAEARIFYSTTAKPASFKSSAVEADKLAPRMITTVGGKLTWRIDTSKQGWNPNLVEIAVLGCHQDQGDDPESIAMAVHQMRQAPDHINALRHPLPLHLARQLQEYVLPLGSDEWEEDDADSDRPMVDIDQVGFDVDLPAQQPG